MDTHDLEQPFKSEKTEATIDVQGRSVALLMEDGMVERGRRPQHTSIPVIEVELSHSEATESEPETEPDTHEPGA